MGRLLPYKALGTLRMAREIEAEEERRASQRAREDLKEAAKHLDNSRKSLGRIKVARAVG